MASLKEREAELLALNKELDRKKERALKEAQHTFKGQEQKFRALDEKISSAATFTDDDFLFDGQGEGAPPPSSTPPRRGRGGGAGAGSSSSSTTSSTAPAPAASPRVRAAAAAGRSSRGGSSGGGGATASSGNSSGSAKARVAAGGVPGGGGGGGSASRGAASSGSSARSTAASSTSLPSSGAAGRGGSGGSGGGGDEEGGDTPGGMGAEATIRYQKARLRVLQDELRISVEKNDTLERRLTDALTKVSELSDQLKKSKRGLTAAENETEKQKKAHLVGQQERAEYEKQVKELQKTVDLMKREAKQVEHEAATKDVRLNRALEENARLKVRVREFKEQNKEESQSSRQDNERMAAEVKRLQRQKTELIGVFKKQLRLIDILKRQKAHIEAARLLAFTEDEFTKTLDLGGPEMKT